MIKFALPELAIIALLFTACCNPADGTADNGNRRTAAAERRVETTAAPATSADAVTELKSGETVPTSKGRLTVVDFNAKWCRPCREFAPTFHKIAEKYGDKAKFVSIDVDANPEISASFNVRSIPQITFILPDGTVRNYVGLMTESDFEGLVKQHLGK